MNNENTTRRANKGSEAMDRGTKIKEWIDARHAEGMVVYVSTHLKKIKIAPKHAKSVRVSNGHCEVARGRCWDSINFCSITARNE